jgi:multicomponent Na+:H+ antiporter subunit E
VVARTAGLFLLWSTLIGFGLTDSIAGALTSLVAARSSLWLLPRGTLRVRPGGAITLALHLAGQAIGAGIDIARRALAPSLPIQPGFIAYPTRLPAGLARDLFAATTSLLPGTLPSGNDHDGALLVHCVDVDRPLAAKLAHDEARAARAFGDG